MSKEFKLFWAKWEEAAMRELDPGGFSPDGKHYCGVEIVRTMPLQENRGEIYERRIMP